MKRAVAVALFFGLSACAGPGATAPSGGLTYRVPDQPSLIYLTADTTNIDIDAGDMGSFGMRGTSEATLAMSFARGEGGVEVTASFEKLNARMSQPMGGAQSASESDIEGPVVFTLDRKGKGTLVSLPQMKGAAESLANPVTIVHEFFPRLPGNAVQPGATWTDTIQYDASTSEGETTSSTVMQYTLVGDTVVDGVSLLHVAFEGTADVVGTGSSEGMEIIQVASGDITGLFLWDPARGVLVLEEATADLTGSVEVPAAGVPPMPMALTGRSVARLQGN